MARQRKIDGRAQVAAAALAIIDQEGLSALTMRGVGRALGVEAMSLYGHVRDRDDLLNAVHALLLQGITPPPPSADWVEDTLSFARRFREKLLEHPRAVPIIATRPALDVPSLDLLEAGLRTIPNTLNSPRAAADIVQTLFVFVVGHCSFYAALADHPHAPVIDEERHPLVSRQAPTSAEDEFEAGLKILAAGLKVTYGSPNPSSS